MEKTLILPIFAILVFAVVNPIYNVNAIATQQTITCGSTITQSVTLEADLDCTNSGTDGIDIGANNIVLDCAGHTITGPFSSQGSTGLDGISLTGVSGVTVTNCHVTSFDNGFVMLSSNNKLVGNTADNNGDGFYIESSSDNMIGDTADNNGGNDFVVFSSNNNQLDNNKAIGNTGLGYDDTTIGSGTAGTANTYNDNKCENNQDGQSSPVGLCEGVL